MRDQYEFGVILKTLPTEGNLVYEYNPFYNYRLDRSMVYYKNRLWEISELLTELGVSFTENDDLETLLSNNIDKIPKSETPPIPYQKGQLVDFDTSQLSFSLNNPVNITPQWSYDNSVNLIINDGLNPPRLINSRFSPTEKNKYQVCNRKGNNDSNIYDQGSEFDIDTSLYKKINNIADLTFLGVDFGGNLSIGNYHFYFRYIDDDGNESDFFAESGLVSIFIGNSADSIYSGFRNQNAHKQVRFRLSDTDSGYQKVSIYYTKSTSDIYENTVITAHKIMNNFKLNDGNGDSIVIITGFEEVQEVSIDEINLRYQIYGSAETQTTAQNILFLGNVDRPKIPYDDLADCALHFIPSIVTEEYNYSQIGYEYTGKTANTYYDPNYIYNKVGYWEDEIYRLGVVFIQSDNTLTDVFNIRGGKISNYSSLSHNIKFYNPETGKRQYISYNEQDYLITDEEVESLNLENVKGVVHISLNEKNNKNIIGLSIEIDKQEVLDYLQNVLNIKGFFFVRQKRIPTTLCQAYTIGIDKESNTPVLPVADNKFITESFLADIDDTISVRKKGILEFVEEVKKQQEKTTIKNKELTHDFDSRLRELPNSQVRIQGAICPEYDVNSPYLNTLFSASELVCRNCTKSQYLKTHNIYSNYLYADNEFTRENAYSNIKVIGVEDNVKLVGINENLFSARAGEAEEAFRFEYIGKKNVNTNATNLLRGSFGPFLGITGYEHAGHLIDIKVPGYNPGNLKDYFLIRYNDKSSYFPITDRFAFYKKINWLDGTKLINPIYRGDCYICQFTHRFNRNFCDPSAPTNDDIVDPYCWRDNFEVTDGVVKKDNFDQINLGDVNAVKLGMYITLTIRSTMNLNIRSLDESIPDEAAMFGHPRGFYPFHPLTTKGSYKIPEALCYNKGFEKSLSERYNFEVPDVPWIKNEFSNRIAYSNIQVQDAFQNGWRTFMGTHYRDYPKTYGSIIRLEEWLGNILCVFEHGVALISVNERAVAGQGSGGYVYINTSNVLPENPKIISDCYGSQWRESVVKTPRFIYGVDTVAKKIWRTDGNSFECISDFKVQEFLNQNISLTERELDPIIGVRNVKSHYNKFKDDVMFTFYDNLYGFEEKVWNLCWNERIQKWITFYSWVPSYSENIYNQFFSFDRTTSKWIAKLGTSYTKSDFADGVTVDNYIIKDNNFSTKLSLSNRNLPTGDNVNVTIEYELVRDNYGNYKLFNISGNTLTFTGNYNDITSEFYLREPDTNKIIKDDKGRRIYLDKEKQINSDKVVILLNIKANIKVTYNGQIPTLGEAYAQGFTNGVEVDAGYYQTVVALIPEYNMQFLTTDFWKHGQAGIIDIADKVYPTYWYGKQHPFEFEFVVANNPDKHKIFDNLEIISNKAAPESFHYEIVGECYDFAKDKKNMYIRQESTKELYQYNGSDIMFDHNYKTLDSQHRPLNSGDPNPKYYDKSTIFPLYYVRQDTINEIEDSYHLFGEKEKYNGWDKNYSALAGAEIVRYENLDEYRICNHAKAVDIHDFKNGRIRGNMQYKEDKWDVQINPINLIQKNESKTDWENKYRYKESDVQRFDLVPAELNIFRDESIIPSDRNNAQFPSLELPEDWTRNIVSWKEYERRNEEVKLKDKFMKVKIRYSGKDLAIITAIKTLYSISYA